MTEPPVTSAVSNSPPDWASVSKEIVCPLCDYNLRGLVEPRCPECGHQFVWQQVLQRRDTLHPYLFEHYPRRNIWSFFRTFVASMFPLRFWKTLRPIHPINQDRLLMYGFLTTLIALFACLPAIFVPVYWYYRQLAQLRYLPSRLAPRSPPFWFIVRSNIFNQGLGERIWLPLAMFVILWPSMTFLSLLLYRISMRQARIHTAHVLRCVIYSSAGSNVMGILLLFISVYGNIYQNQAIMVVAELTMVLLMYRLMIAYQIYLGFRHAIAAVAGSQIIVALAMFKCYLVWQGY